MRVRWAWILLVGFGVSAARAEPVETPTREQVLDAVQTLREGAGDEAGEARLRAWGDAALPHLEDLANHEEGLAEAPSLLFSLHAIGTPKAADLLVRILDDETRVPGFLAAALLFAVRDEFLAHLAAHPRFKEAALQHMSGMGALGVLQICVELQWVDQVDRIRALETALEPEVRRAAAAALVALTGEKDETGATPLRCPAESLVADLLGEPTYVPRQLKRDPTFLAAMRWTDGQSHLVYGFDPGVPSFGHRPVLRIAAADLQAFTRWPMPGEVQRLLLAPTEGGATQVVALVDEEQPAGRSSDWGAVLAFTPEGEVRWRWSCDDRFLRDLVPLYGAEGPVGMAVAPGGDIGIVGVDLEGRPLWDLPRRYVVHNLSTHRSLPGRLLHVSSDLTVYEHDATRVTGETDVDDEGVLPMQAVLVPDGEGGAAILEAGRQLVSGQAILRRLDLDGAVVWEATLPAEITALAMLEAPDVPRLVVVTSDQGGLFVFDEEGTLRWRGELPFARKDGGVETEALAAGEVAPGRHAILVKQVQSCYVIPVHLERLRALRVVPVELPGGADGE